MRRYRYKINLSKYVFYTDWYKWDVITSHPISINEEIADIESGIKALFQSEFKHLIHVSIEWE